MADEKTYKIKIKGEFENFKQVSSQIQSLLSNKNIDLGEGVKKNISKFQTLFDSLSKKFEDSFSDTNVGSEMFKTILTEFRQLADLAKSIGLNILPKETETRIASASENLKNLERDLKNAKARLRTAETGLDEEGNLSVKKQDSLFVKAGGTKLDTGSDKVFGNIGDVKAEVAG